MDDNNNAKFLQLTTSTLIDAYQNESVLWDTARNASEEEKELAWARLATLFKYTWVHSYIVTKFSTIKIQQVTHQTVVCSILRTNSQILVDPNSVFSFGCIYTL
jgi:hypothetical protein